MIALEVESLNSETVGGEKSVNEMRFSVNRHFTNV